jgi:ribosomal protein L11 methylase PrmA
VDLAVANISPEAIIALAPELVRVVHAQGIAIVSGFETQDVSGVTGALTANGARVRESHTRNSWSAVVTAKS